MLVQTSKYTFQHYDNDKGDCNNNNVNDNNNNSDDDYSDNIKLAYLRRGSWPNIETIFIHYSLQLTMKPLYILLQKLE